MKIVMVNELKSINVGDLCCFFADFKGDVASRTEIQKTQ